MTAIVSTVVSPVTGTSPDDSADLASPTAGVGVTMMDLDNLSVPNAWATPLLTELGSLKSAAVPSRLGSGWRHTDGVVTDEYLPTVEDGASPSRALRFSSYRRPLA